MWWGDPPPLFISIFNYAAVVYVLCVACPSGVATSHQNDSQAYSTNVNVYIMLYLSDSPPEVSDIYVALHEQCM